MKKQITVCIALLSLMFAGCEEVQKLLSIQKPTLKMKGLSLQDATVESATLMFDVEIENPYSVSLPLTNLNYNVSTSGNKLFTGSADLQQYIPANSKKIISLPATVNYMEMLTAVKGINPGSKIPYKADVELSVTTPATGDMILPVSKTGNLDLPEIGKSAVKGLLNNLLSK